MKLKLRFILVIKKQTNSYALSVRRSVNFILLFIRNIMNTFQIDIILRILVINMQNREGKTCNVIILGDNFHKGHYYISMSVIVGDGTSYLKYCTSHI